MAGCWQGLSPWQAPHLTHLWDLVSRSSATWSLGPTLQQHQQECSASQLWKRPNRKLKKNPGCWSSSVCTVAGGSYTLTLSNLLGNRFDRLKPTAKAKKSILLWSDNIPGNPVQQLPFASDRSINFSTPDTFIWRFPKEFENTTQEFRIKGRMDFTYITNINQQTVWETRMMPFECKLEQELAPCD